ncbi:glycosyltransferase [Amycolatopsis sacchari]|uniref:glycosyltransferase n=1 Tax=Amycolatopsis sacchari TaxID=115433 RepID=UPI003D7561B0
MRILFTFVGGSGHFRPLVPLARAAAAAGHTVAFACPGRMVPAVEKAGFPALATSPPGGAPPDRLPLSAPDPQREERDLREHFARTGGRENTPVLLKLAGQWRPDVVVRCEVDFGAALAAERLGLPCAVVLVLAAGGFLRPGVVAEPLHELRAEQGLPADPRLRMLAGDLVLAPFPPSFRDPRFPLPDGTFAFRQGDLRPPAEGEVVYFTLGTVFNTESGDLFSRVLAGLRKLPAPVVATTGEHIDPAEFGPQPEHVRIDRFVPQESLLPRCAVVVSHGGSGSVLGALAHGVPSVLLPMGADQPHNARRSLDLGTARLLDPVTVTPEDVEAAVSAVLADERYRQAADRLREETNALPGADAAVPLLEKLT